MDDPCAVEETDYIRQVGGPETNGELHVLRCDGTTWQLLFGTKGNSQFIFNRQGSDSQIQSLYGYLRLQGGGTPGTGLVVIDSPLSLGSDKLTNSIGNMEIDVSVDDAVGRDLIIKAMGAENFRFTGDGKVGIGTDDPVTALHIQQGGARIYASSATYFTIGEDAAIASVGWSEWQSGHVSGIRIRAARSDPTYPAIYLSGEGGVVFQTNNGSSTATADSELARLSAAGNFGIGTNDPQSALHVPDGKYIQAEDNNAGPPPTADCDIDTERGRLSIDTASNRLYICNGAARSWDYVDLND